MYRGNKHWCIGTFGIFSWSVEIHFMYSLNPFVTSNICSKCVFPFQHIVIKHSGIVDWNFWMCPQVLQSCGSPELVQTVISPHLSKDTVDFLRGHLTPKEMTIFELLGDGWTKPRYRNDCIYITLLSKAVYSFTHWWQGAGLTIRSNQGFTNLSLTWVHDQGFVYV